MSAMKNLLFFLMFVSAAFVVSVACLAVAVFIALPLGGLVGPFVLMTLWVALLMMMACILDGAMDRLMMSRFARKWWTKGN